MESMESASLESHLHKLATDAVKEHESEEIEEQKKVKILNFDHSKGNSD